MVYTYVTADNSMIKDSAGKYIPCDPENSDYAALVAAGTVIMSYVAPPISVPASISRIQCAKQLFLDGYITTAAYMQAMAADAVPPPFIRGVLDSIADAATRAFAYSDFASDRYFRAHPLLVDFLQKPAPQGLGKTSAEVDAFFIAAAQQ